MSHLLVRTLAASLIACAVLILTACQSLSQGDSRAHGYATEDYIGASD